MLCAAINVDCGLTYPLCCLWSVGGQPALSCCAVEHMEEGQFLTLRNAKIDMYKGSMRLAVNQWGVIEKAADQPDFEVKVRLAPGALCSAWLASFKLTSCPP